MTISNNILVYAPINLRRKVTENGLESYAQPSDSCAAGAVVSCAEECAGTSDVNIGDKEQ